MGAFSLLRVVRMPCCGKSRMAHSHYMLTSLRFPLKVSAEQIAGQRTPGKPRGEIRWHGSQPGKINLADRELKVKRPRLRHKREGEVKIPAYERLRQDRGLQQHMLGALMRGISTRKYDEVLPKHGRNGWRFAQLGQPASGRGER